KKKIKVAFDVADPFAVKRFKNDFLRIIEKNADFIFANNEEASILFDGAGPEKAASLIAEMGKTAVVKWGKHGSLIKRAKEELIKIPILGDKGRVDTTGAGDTYASGFLYSLCKGKDLETAGRSASFLASAIVAKIGAQFTEDESALLKGEIGKI
ncbi:MAG: PfkB family carbohydrate kinase, partial [Spirochaetia bacterium]|nr:PfkB family carbohydrate kinase [Spirochaetia bacterium]